MSIEKKRNYELRDQAATVQRPTELTGGSPKNSCSRADEIQRALLDEETNSVLQNEDTKNEKLQEDEEGNKEILQAEDDVEIVVPPEEGIETFQDEEASATVSQIKNDDEGNKFRVFVAPDTEYVQDSTVHRS